jgi:excisionase family DNA binding protein
MPDTMIGARQVAARLGVHENTIRNWEERGILRALRLPGSGYRRFDLEEVERLAQEMHTQFAPADEGPALDGSTLQGVIVHGDIE